MGNTQSGSTLTRTTGALDSFVAELGTDIVYEKSLGSARFLKTVRCRHRNGFMVIKVFVKPDPGVTLRNYHRRLKADREALLDIPNIYNYQSFVETDRAGYIIRQWVASNLYDRISTRPFLSPIEKKWIAFQILTALRDARNRKISHGDLKSENFLVTSWNWVYVSDFASFKPTYLPLDDPSEFSYFFDTSGRRTCYIAPERFYTAESNPDISAKKSRLASEDNEGKRDGKVTEAMDCFSVGCVIAELFREGAPLFNLSQLFRYRSGDYSVDAQLAEIEDEGIRDIIKQMIKLDPKARPTFDSLLHVSRGTVFPECFFSFLHNYVASVNELSNAGIFATPSNPPPSATSISGNTVTSTGIVRPGATGTIEDPINVFPSDSDHRIERIWEEYESLEPYLVSEEVIESQRFSMDVKVDYLSSVQTSKPFQDVLPVELYIPNRDSHLPGATEPPRHAVSQDGPMLIVLALVTSNIRNCALPSVKVRALDLLLSVSVHLTDEAKLDRLIPYAVELLHDEATVVRIAAFRTVIQILMMVTVVTPSNAAIFPEYIIPNIKYLDQDPEVSVRCCYAQCLAQVVETAVRYLEMAQALKAHGTIKFSSDGQGNDAAPFQYSYDSSMQELQSTIEEHISTFLMDPSSVVKRAVLHDISSLCIFLGKQKTNDVLLSHMITYLNDRDWLLRYAFFESIVDVAACAGGRSLEEYILPLMIQALSDTEETVVAKVLAALTSLCELGLFQKMRIWELMSATLGFLYHPNSWIQQRAAAFIASAAHHLPSSDVWCILYPSLRNFMKTDIVEIKEESLLAAVKSPVSRQMFDAALQWAMGSDKSSFWRGSRSRRSSKAEHPRDSVSSMRRSATSLRMRSEDEDAQIRKLQQLGMTQVEEIKLMTMKDYILKLSDAISSFAARSVSDTDGERRLRTTGDVKLLSLEVVPQTVFLKDRTSDTSSRLLFSPYPSFQDQSRLSTPVPRTPKLSSPDGGTPVEDLRRKLATINASSSSLATPQTPREPRSPTLPSRPPSTTPATSEHPEPAVRSPSPAESSVSTTNPTSFRPLSRMQMGAFDRQKAAPAIGSSRANATGHFESHGKPSYVDSIFSGRSTPLSPATNIRMTPPRQQLTVSTYDGHEPGISAVLETLYLDDQRELQQEFGPRVREAPIRRRNAGRHSYVSRHEGRKRLEASLVANLTSHSECITGLAVSPDHMFFVSCSDDKTVKVWDTARLERNVTSKPRQTYGQHHARVKCICIIETSYCFASAADDGSLHVVRVHVNSSGNLPKYTKLQIIREHRVQGTGGYITSMLHYNTETTSNLIYATTHSRIVILDLLTMRTLQDMQNPRHYGPITTVCIDKNRCWIIVGTSAGTLSLWDRRFGLLLKSWKVGSSSGSRSSRITHCVVHPTRGKGKWVIVSLETPHYTDASTRKIVEVWDIEKTALVEQFVSRSFSAQEGDPLPEPSPPTEVKDDVSSAIATLVQSHQSERKAAQIRSIVSPSADVLSMLVGSEFGNYSSGHPSYVMERSAERSQRRAGYMITGSGDCRLRFWDLGTAEKSTVLSETDGGIERPTFSSKADGSVSSYIETWNRPSVANQSNRAQQRISLINQSQQKLLKAHQDVITALASIESPFRGGIVSGDRVGSIKVWRVDIVGEQ